MVVECLTLSPLQNCPVLLCIVNIIIFDSNVWKRCSTSRLKNFFSPPNLRATVHQQPNCFVFLRFLGINRFGHCRRCTFIIYLCPTSSSCTTSIPTWTWSSFWMPLGLPSCKWFPTVPTSPSPVQWMWTWSKLTRRSSLPLFWTWSDTAHMPPLFIVYHNFWNFFSTKCKNFLYSPKTTKIKQMKNLQHT